MFFNITRKLPSLVGPLVFHVGGNEVVTCNPKAIKRHFRTQGQLVRESGAQVFSSLLPVMGSTAG